ncbi:MAG: hypothetical protein WEB57_05775 [Pseudohongiellaceae bacterium]
MKKTPIRARSLLLALALLPALWHWPATASGESVRASLADSWSGRFQVGNYPPLELVFHIQQEEDGTLAARLDIPSQYRTGIPADRVSLDGQRLVMQFPDVQAEFLGSIRVDDEGGHVQRISGDWSQSGEFVALSLQRHENDD